MSIARTKDKHSGLRVFAGWNRLKALVVKQSRGLVYLFGCRQAAVVGQVMALGNMQIVW